MQNDLNGQYIHTHCHTNFMIYSQLFTNHNSTQIYLTIDLDFYCPSAYCTDSLIQHKYRRPHTFNSPGTITTYHTTTAKKTLLEAKWLQTESKRTQIAARIKINNVQRLKLYSSSQMAPPQTPLPPPPMPLLHHHQSLRRPRPLSRFRCSLRDHRNNSSSSRMSSLHHYHHH